MIWRKGRKEKRNGASRRRKIGSRGLEKGEVEDAGAEVMREL